MLLPWLWRMVTTLLPLPLDFGELLKVRNTLDEIRFSRLYIPLRFTLNPSFSFLSTLVISIYISLVTHAFSRPCSSVGRARPW